MRLSSRFWYLLSVVLFVGAVWFWLKGNEEAARRQGARGTAAGPNTNGLSGANARSGAGAGSAGLGSNQPGSMIPGSGATPGGGTGAGTAPPSAAGPPRRFGYRLSNTEQPLRVLGRSDTAILLDNAFIDTAKQRAVEVPEPLRAKGDGGSYIVQWRGPLDSGFYARLREAGGEFVSYIPNNAGLVRVTAEGARQLMGQSGMRAVLAYEPYYKLAQPLLGLEIGRAHV